MGIYKEERQGKEEKQRQGVKSRERKAPPSLLSFSFSFSFSFLSFLISSFLLLFSPTPSLLLALTAMKLGVSSFCFYLS
jgi:hypothetical protein